LPVKPYIVVSVESGNAPPQPPFNPTEVFIYARSALQGGSDLTGNGSLAKPYLTIERAVRDVPTDVPAGVTYHVDVTGTGLQTLPEMYEFPKWNTTESIGDFEFDERFFYYYGAVNITADPQLATGVTGITTIPLVGAVPSVPKASTGLIAIQFAGAGWTPGQLKGKFAIGAGLGTEHSVIWDNTADTIFITKTSTPTFPIEIMECSARLQASKDPARLHRAAINLINSQAVFGGIGFASTNGPDGQFSNWGLQIGGTTPPTGLILCDIRGAGFVAESWVRARACYMPGALFMMAPLALTGCFIDESFTIGGPFKITVWGARGGDNLIRQSVIKGTTPIFFRDLFDQFNGGTVPILDLQNVQLLDTLPNFAPPTANDMSGPINSAIFWTGGQAYLMGVDIEQTAPVAAVPGATNAAITVSGNGAHMQLRNVTSTGSLYPTVGVAAVDGGFVVQNDVPLQPFVPVGPVTTIAGTAGAFQSGSNAVAATWPLGLPAVGSFDSDFTDQGTRISRKS
jgi:hypothetical protein